MNNDFQKRAHAYLNEVVHYSKKLLGDNLVSIVLFGSLARNEAEKISDVDILIVVKKKNKKTKILERIIRALEIRYGFITPPRGFFEKLFFALSQVTGMFRPVFIAEYKDVRKWIFHKIFGTSTFMTRILAPTESVKFTILKSYKIIYGIDPFSPIRINDKSFGNLIKSLFMNSILAISSFVLLPFYKETYKFVYESMKWSMFAYAYASAMEPHISRLSQLFIEPLRRGMEHFIYTRKNGKLSPGLFLYAIPSIVKIHISSIKKLKARLGYPRNN